MVTENKQKINVPEELTSRKQWIRWKLDNGNKVPTDIIGTNCDPYKEENQHSYAAVEHYDKIGFVLSDPYCGIDLDGCYTDGKFTPWAQAVIEKFRGIAHGEISPSGNGAKLWTRARKPKGAGQDLLKLGNHTGIQWWDQKRWFAVTGQVIDGLTSIGDGQAAVDWLWDQHKPKAKATRAPEATSTSCASDDVRNKPEAAHLAIAKIEIPSDENDGSSRMVKYCAQAVKFCTDASVALQVVKDALAKNPTPTEWTEERFIKEIANSKAVPGESIKNDSSNVDESATGGNCADETSKNTGKKGVSSENPNSKKSKQVIPDLSEYKPFPVETLPEALAKYVTEVALSIPCDPAYVAMPLLAGLGSCIGNSLALRLKRIWMVPPIIWAAVIAPSGSGKSAPPDMALRPLNVRQKKLVKKYDQELDDYLKKNEVYMKELADFKKNKEAGEPPTPPVEPVCARIVVGDTTIEALAKRLNDNPRGILARYDELTGWLNTFNKYSKGGGDEAKWLEFYNAQYSVVDRASAKRPLIIDRASVCLFGTIQPKIIRKYLTEEYKASGLAARVLFAMPPSQMKQWQDSEVDEEVENEVANIFDRLLAIEMRVDEEGDLKPSLVKPNHLAMDKFIAYFNRHNREQQELSDDIRAAYAKLEEVAARLALIIHAVRYVTGDAHSLYNLDVESMDAGIELCEWFKSEAKRVYAVLSESDTAHENRTLIQWLDNQNGPVSPRDFHRHHTSLLESVAVAEKMLQTFVNAELGEWVPSESTDKGGRPTRRFQLANCRRNPQKPNDSGGFVSNFPPTDQKQAENDQPEYGAEVAF